MWAEQPVLRVTRQEWQALPSFRQILIIRHLPIHWRPARPVTQDRSLSKQVEYTWLSLKVEEN
jgi:hypothetical protein